MCDWGLVYQAMINSPQRREIYDGGFCRWSDYGKEINILFLSINVLHDFRTLDVKSIRDPDG